MRFSLGRALFTHGFLERYFEQGDSIPDSVLLAVNNDRKLGFDSLAQHYAYQLRKPYYDSPDVVELRKLV